MRDCWLCFLDALCVVKWALLLFRVAQFAVLRFGGKRFVHGDGGGDDDDGGGGGVRGEVRP